MFNSSPSSPNDAPQKDLPDCEDRRQSPAPEAEADVAVAAPAEVDVEDDLLPAGALLVHLHPADPRRNAPHLGAQPEGAPDELKVESLPQALLEVGPQLLHQLVQPLGPLEVGEVNPPETDWAGTSPFLAVHSVLRYT